MRTVFSILGLVLLLSPAVLGQAQEEEEVSWEEEEQAAIRGPRLQAAPVQSPGPDRGPTAVEAEPPTPTALPAPQLVPLPEIETSAWTLLFPGACLALVALNVGWRRKRTAPGSDGGGPDD